MVGLITKQWYDFIMQRPVWKNRNFFVVFLVSLFIIPACAPTSTPSAIPTLAAVAGMPAADSIANALESDIVIPGTFTPAPQLTLDARNNFGDSSEMSLTAVASSMPFIPTNTPRPTWAPPTRTPLPTPTFTPSPTPVVPPVPYPSSGPRPS
ncbi:MAG: hypothetical protein DWQ04_20690, partial [Chloroflexi bacterium]